ncbi:tRNA-uridine aminocarboxypropyltransferase 1-like [Diadema antillarum]|uniref:tRNA-uridine aminocarboxypropyltransferase 1-like n=1 Tax=Diadema antillarum TaxID=105358 RepID=UPI003A86F027
MEKKRPRPADGHNPFSDLHISSHEPLKSTASRTKCSKCGASRKYFCYTCYLPVPDLKGKLPLVELPVKVDVIKHAQERDGKSTAIHAAILAPNDVTIYTYPCIPDYDKGEGEVVLVYPGTDAISLAELAKELQNAGRTAQEEQTNNAESDGKVAACTQSPISCPFKKVVFIDCTWNQTHSIYRDERLRDLRCIILRDRTTYFWRGQNKPDSYLATIEAIYYFMLDYHAAFEQKTREGKREEEEQMKGVMQKETCSHRYDDLLYFYSFMYQLVHREPDERKKPRKETENG